MPPHTGPPRIVAAPELGTHYYRLYCPITLLTIEGHTLHWGRSQISKIPHRPRPPDPDPDLGPSSHQPKKRKQDCSDAGCINTNCSDQGPSRQTQRQSSGLIMADQRMSSSMDKFVGAPSDDHGKPKPPGSKQEIGTLCRFIYDKEFDPPIFESFKMVTNDIVIKRFCKYDPSRPYKLIASIDPGGKSSATIFVVGGWACIKIGQYTSVMLKYWLQQIDKANGQKKVEAAIAADRKLAAEQASNIL
ncbi:hypothetical protein HDU97_007738 [Phlyctochytrium planicorne]|nr:hypothetical protein HDU97_007738 [Phlyctochytrium planicorne]